MQVTTEQLRQIPLFSGLDLDQLVQLRLAQFIQTAAIAEGTDVTEQRLQLRPMRYLQSSARLPYYQMARSIGITIANGHTA